MRRPVSWPISLAEHDPSPLPLPPPPSPSQGQRRRQGQDGEAGYRAGGGGAKRILLTQAEAESGGKEEEEEEAVLGHFNFCNSCSLFCDRTEEKVTAAAVHRRVAADFRQQSNRSS